MTVAACRLSVGKEALWHEQMQVVLGARHRDIQQPALFFDLRAGSRAEV
jgi:hypothetical protein